MALLLVSGIVTVAPAGATEVDRNLPDEVITSNKNPSCNDLGYAHGFKIEGVPTNTTYDVKDNEHDSNTVVGQVVITDAGDYGFSWSTEDSDPPIAFDAVIVKASDAANAYYYDPAATHDENLESVEKTEGNEEGFHQISHVNFCWDAQQAGEKITVTKQWFDENGDPMAAPDPAPALEVTVTFDDQANTEVVLDEEDLAPSEDVTVPDGIDITNVNDPDVTVEETSVPNGYEQINCPTPQTAAATVTENVEFVICNQASPESEGTVTVRKIWLDSSGDMRDAPSDSDIEITVDVVEGQDVVLTHDDLTNKDGDSLIVDTGVDPGNVGEDGVQETNVPNGWSEVTCPTAIDREFGQTADHVFCNKRRSGGGGGGGTTTTTTSTTTSTTTTTIGELPFTPEPEVLPEVIERPTTTTTAPQLPFTGTNSATSALVGAALLTLGGSLVIASRRRKQIS